MRFAAESPTNTEVSPDRSPKRSGVIAGGAGRHIEGTDSEGYYDSLLLRCQLWAILVGVASRCRSFSRARAQGRTTLGSAVIACAPAVVTL